MSNGPRTVPGTNFVSELLKMSVMVFRWTFIEIEKFFDHTRFNETQRAYVSLL